MAEGFESPKVTLHIGDGFKWLQDNKAAYDVIITDSSDPVGPANSLFQTPYFELLKNALAPGGTIATQGECMWLHLPLITQLQSDVKKLFPNVEYAWTSIPTYPSGTIGFLVATLDEKRDLKKPQRVVKPTRYWSQAVHKAAFVKPEFLRKGIAEGPATAANKPQKKVLLMGSGFVAHPAAEYVLRRSDFALSVACRTLKSAEEFCATLSRPAQPLSVDASDEASLDAAVKEHDLVVSLIPYTMHKNIIASAIRHKKHVVTTSYVSEAMMSLNEEAKKAGIVVMNEIGLDPGIDHLYAVKIIDEVHREGGKVDTFLSYCGGLPAPSSADNPLGYKFSWSSRGVLLALLNTGKFYENGKIREIAGKDLMSIAKSYYINPAFAFVCYPNRDSTIFAEKYGIPEVQNLIRGTLRYQGFPEFIGALVKLGFLNESPVEYLAKGASLPWAEATAKVIGATDSSEACVGFTLCFGHLTDTSPELWLLALMSWSNRQTRASSAALFRVYGGLVSSANSLSRLAVTLLTLYVPHSRRRCNTRTVRRTWSCFNISSRSPRRTAAGYGFICSLGRPIVECSHSVRNYGLPPCLITVPLQVQARDHQPWPALSAYLVASPLSKCSMALSTSREFTRRTPWTSLRLF